MGTNEKEFSTIEGVFMKRSVCFALVLGMVLSLAGCGAGDGGFGFWTAVLVLLGLAVLAFAALRTVSFVQYNRRKRKNPRWKKKAVLDPVTIGLYAAGVVILLLAMLTTLGGSGDPDPSGTQESDPSSSTGTTTEPTASTEATEPPVLFQATGSDSSDPDLWGVNWEILVDGQEVEAYTRQEEIRFGDPEDYFSLPGIGAFRGNNYRDSATYGTADVQTQTISMAWTYQTSTLAGSTWSGSGWTGQPLIVQWDEETRNNMNIYDSKKAKDGLVEIIYATLDGHIYFLDLDDGSQTRDPINVGMCFKGAGSLDPRGYPLLYVGSGDVNSSGKQPRMFIISLIDGSILYEYGNDDPLSVRRDNDDWCAFDSSPLVDAETDTLIWPGENGILYTIKLNSSYDAAAGTVSVSPEPTVVTRYQTNRSSEEEYWFGYEASVNIVEGYLYVSENGGLFYCVDLNTMELVWAQDTKDDSNASPVFERTADDQGYIYTAPSLHWTKNSDYTGTISIYKLDAVTGEIVWEKPYDVHTVDGVSGGVQSTPLLGKTGSTMEGLIIYSVSRIPYQGSGILVALDTQTGEEVWRKSLDSYAWSSPVAVYDEDGTGYVVLCDSGGTAYFLDGATGTTLDTLDMGGLVEASPAVFGDMLVVGTRAEKICGVKIG